MSSGSFFSVNHISGQVPMTCWECNSTQDVGARKKLEFTLMEHSNVSKKQLKRHLFPNVDRLIMH